MPGQCCSPRRPRAARCFPRAIVPALAFAFAPLAACAQGAPTAATDSAVVILLGTGNPAPNPAAQGPATAVVVGKRIFLFDAGPGVERQMAAAKLPVRGGPLTAVFFTHLHSDHTLGYPDLIFTSWVMRRSAPLQAYGPHGLRAMTDHILAAWAEDIDVRTNGLEHETPGGYRVSVHEIGGAGVVYDSGGVRITAIPVLHGSWKQAFGYRVDAPGRSIVISGDTRPSPALLEAARGVDVLVHEVYPATMLPIASHEAGRDPTAYFRAFHTSDTELGQLAAQARPKLLVLTHIVGDRSNEQRFVDAIRAAGFTGRVAVGHDLDRF